MSEHHSRRPQENLDELPEHERRPEGDTGAGLTSSAISAEQRGPVDEEVIESQTEDEPAMDPDKPPPAYRARPG